MKYRNRMYVDIMVLHPEVTGSCIFVSILLPFGGRIHFIVDCGLFQELEYLEFNKTFPFNPRKIIFCLITHSHIDHVGRFPFLVKQGFSKAIYATNTTKIVLTKAFKNCLKKLERKQRYGEVKNLYEIEDANKTLLQVIGYEYNEAIQVHKYVKVTFLENEHMPGAALILVQISYPEQKDINILFTGDYNNKKVEKIPEWVLELPLTVITESTRGDEDEIENKEVETVSSHIKANQAIDFLNKFKNLQLILINHGRDNVKKIFAERVKKEVKSKEVKVLRRNYWYRITSEGLEKENPTNFE